MMYRWVPALLALCAAGFPIAASAQNFPNAPVRIISPYPPGGGTDILARAIGRKAPAGSRAHHDPA